MRAKNILVSIPIPILISLAACSTPAGVIVNGNITPCDGYHTDNQACGNAVLNSGVIGAVHAGQSYAEVRSIMRHDPERRTIEGNKESWGFITDYQAEIMTWIVFTDGRVTAMQQAPWKE